MSGSAPFLTHESVVDFWRRRFRRQRHVNAGVRSLLRKYGATSSSRGVSNDLLLTLMGNLITSDASFYRTSADGLTLVPAVALGATALDELPTIPMETPFAQIAAEGGPPRLLNSLPRGATDDPAIAPVAQVYKLFAPLQFEHDLQGIVFLGGKVSGGAFTDNDVELIEALCAVTGAVLHYMDAHQSAGLSESQAVHQLSRCQEVAGGIADHLERTLITIESLSGTASSDADATGRLAQVSQHAGAIRYLLSSLRLLANDPAALTGGGSSGERYDVVDALQSVIMSFSPATSSSPNALNYRNEMEGTRCVSSVTRQTAEAALQETLDAAFQQCPQADMLIVQIDQATGLPTEIGQTADASSESDPMLRIRIEARRTDSGETGGSGGMKMLADNLEAFQTLREPGAHQAALTADGGTIVWRRDDAAVAYLIYVPLVSA